jgi:hypothetical protein
VYSQFLNTINITATTTTTTTTTTAANNNNNNNSILYYLCAESTATQPITDST